MDEREIISRDYLSTILDNYIIVIDLSVVLDRNFLLFAEHIEELGEPGRIDIFMSQIDWANLKGMIANPNGYNLDHVEAAVSHLEQLCDKKYLCFVNNVSQFSSLCSMFPNDVRLCILTQQLETADNVINWMTCHEDYLIRRINKYGYMSTFNNGDIGRYQYLQNRPLTVPQRIVSLTANLSPVSHIPSEGEIVYVDDNHTYTLKSKVESVSDGIIYDSGDGCFVKIFHREKIDVYHKEKCKAMLQRRVRSKSVCWPINLIYNSNHQFIGYTFKAYEGEPLNIAVFKKAGLDNFFPNWKKADLVQLAITILGVIGELHRSNILIGCPDTRNIRVVNPRKVYFIETDKYQFDNFPCLLRFNVFLPPERIDYRDKRFLFSEATENYVVAVLTFMILMPGKEPYSKRYGGNSVNNIKNMQFPYPFRDNHAQGAPDGFWRFVWSHIYYDLKEAFYKTFQREQEFNTPRNRRSLNVWIRMLKDYHEKLITGEYCRYDRYSALVFPDTFRIVRNVEYKRCDYCKKDFPEWYMDDKFENLCKRCRNKMSNESFTCNVCGKTFYYSVKEDWLHKRVYTDWIPQKHCRACKKYRITNNRMGVNTIGTNTRNF